MEKKKRRYRWAFSLDVHEGTSRLEAFSDGVFAIAATLLAVDLKVPRRAPDAAALAGALLDMWPSYVSYAMSFIYLGIYWTHHHFVFRFFRRTDHIFLKLNVLFLMLIAVIPFPTALIGAFMFARDDRQRVAMLVYSGILFVTSAVFVSMWVYATQGRRLVDEDLDEHFVRLTSRRYLIAPVSYALAFILAFWDQNVALIIVLMSTVFYLIPIRTKLRGEAPALSIGEGEEP